MLEELIIKNFGIIEDIVLSFASGLNILTGETGAGKSILIDALRFGLGERFQSSHMRDGADTCLVQAVFRLPPSFIKTFQNPEEFALDSGDLILQRSVTNDGRNKIRINGLAATVTQLKEIGDSLIDFHGPHDHQQLLAENMHLAILDALTDFGTLKDEYAATFSRYSAIQKKINELEVLSRSRERDLDLLTHQIRELEQVPLEKDYLKELERDRLKINNAEKLFENISRAVNILENNEASLESLLSSAARPIQNLADIDDKASSFVNDLAALQDNARGLLTALRDYADSMNFDPGRAQKINDESDAFRVIQKKYGPTLEDARTFYEEAMAKHALLADFEHSAETLQDDLRATEQELAKIARAVTHKRKKTAELLKTTIEQELRELGFKVVNFEARLDKKPLSPDGADHAVFFITTNAGESMKPLAGIVSSGEAARIMLAVKRALMKVDPVPVLIFDEIDAQIGGRLGTVIGTKLKEISRFRQVVLITHLPQIAAFADSHSKIAKTTQAGRTKVVIDTLNTQKARIQEMAHMMTGDQMTPVALRHAEDMLEKAKNEK